MNHRDYMRRIEDKIGAAKAADRIGEDPGLIIVVERYIKRLC
jgi:hypothetical protein